MSDTEKHPVVVAKFFVAKIEHVHNYSSPTKIAKVTLNPVVASSEANKSWSQHTPQGEMWMMITNPAAVDMLDLGKEYFVHFTPAE